MADEQAQDATQDAQDATGETQTDQAAGAGTQTAGTAEKFDAAYVKSLRDEAAAHRKKLRETETRLKALEDEKLSDTEKRERDLKDAQERATAAEARAHLAEIKAAASAAGAVNPARVAQLIEPGTEDAEKAVAALKKSDPYLFNRPGAGSADGGAGGEPPKGRSMNDLIRQAAGRN